MILYGIAIAILLLGLGLILVAYLSAHRTIIPVMRQAVYLWWPGLVLVALSGLVALVPSLFGYGQCQAACDVLDGTPEHPASLNVPQDYENCVRSGLNEVKRNVVERMKDGATGLDPDKAAAEAEPGLREVCHDMVIGQCVAACYNPQQGEAGAEPVDGVAR